MRTTLSVAVAAPPALVYRLAHDVERWERLLPHYDRSRVVRRSPGGELVTEFIARRPFRAAFGFGLPVAWRARTWSEPTTLRLRFVHVAGATRGMDVTWRIEPLPSAVGTASDDAGPVESGAFWAGAVGSLVSIDHVFHPRLPGFARFVDRAFTRPIASRTLATFKALAEALAEMADGGPATDTAANLEETRTVVGQP